jgi:hypothetical protein
MYSSRLHGPSTRTIVFDNIVGISLKGAFWQAEPPQTIWKRIQCQLDARQGKGLRRRTGQLRLTVRPSSSQESPW